MHHAQRHCFTPLMLHRQAGCPWPQGLISIELRRQRHTRASVTHWPTIVVMQVIGIVQQCSGLPDSSAQRLHDGLLGADMVRMRVETRMWQNNDLGLNTLDQLAQVTQQIVPGRDTISITAQGEWIELPEKTRITKLCLAGHNGFAWLALHQG
ncbi:hypothetical protein D3C72_1966500 [compost metagenome]